MTHIFLRFVFAKSKRVGDDIRADFSFDLE